MAPNQVCSICNKTFTNYCGLTSHLRLYEPCQTRLLSQIPPIPPVVFNRRIPEAQSPDEVSAGHPRRSGRYSANENTQTMEFGMFPDNDLSDVESEHPVDQIPPLAPPPPLIILQTIPTSLHLFPLQDFEFISKFQP